MQILGGTGYADVFPIGGLMLDRRLITIWTATDEIVDLVIQHELIEGSLGRAARGRAVEGNADHAGMVEEKFPEQQGKRTDPGKKKRHHARSAQLGG